MKIHQKIFIGIIILIGCILLNMPVTARQANAATTTYNLLVPLPIAQNQPATTTISTIDLTGYANDIIIVVISLTIVIAVFMITYGGFIWMSTDSISQHSEGREIIQRTLWGLLILAASFLLLHFINPNLNNIAKFSQSGQSLQAQTKPSS